MVSYDIKDQDPCLSSDLCSVLSCYDHLMRERAKDPDRSYYNAVLIAELISERLDIDLSGGDLMLAYDYISNRCLYK